ncbi:class I SAM-dependent methyltransferase [Candidatus Pelagibacter sp.]|uniref:class I SAM-dependent methyltransferase n=1 Tax=Candidatus Pelagibacter sp. TaxID=2024849 RepID=UPI003F82FD14
MTKIIGDPSKNNEFIKKILKKPTFSEKYIFHKNEFREEILSKIKSDMSILDIGKSMRDKYEKIACKEKKTLDLNIFDDYPDYQFDLSCELIDENSILFNKFDAVICLAVLEHVYNPFIAINNIKSMLKKDGIMFGYIPFLYHYHAPENLEFQDFFRYSKDGVAFLLKDFKEVKLYPVRGRLSSSMHILMGSLWKKYFEKFKINRLIDKFSSNEKNKTQCGGYNFIAKL